MGLDPHSFTPVAARLPPRSLVTRLPVTLSAGALPSLLPPNRLSPSPPRAPFAAVGHEQDHNDADVLRPYCRRTLCGRRCRHVQPRRTGATAPATETRLGPPARRVRPSPTVSAESPSET